MRPCVRFLNLRGLFAAALAVASLLAAPQPVSAQVVVLVNGSPVTALDIDQRTKLEQMTTNKTPTRQQVINVLIDDRIKMSIAKRYNFSIGENDVEEAFNGMARRARMNPEQLVQMLGTRGIDANAFKSKLRADITWAQLMRGKYGASLQVGETDVNNALQTREAIEKEPVGYTYTLYPIVMVVPNGAGEVVLEGRRREAENLRSRFQSCGDGLKLARTLRDVAVRDVLVRNSADLTPQLRELLSKLELGRLTSPERTAQGLQMFALCEKKESGPSSDSAAKREVRDEIFAKRFEAQAKKYLNELRGQAMIEYR